VCDKTRERLEGLPRKEGAEAVDDEAPGKAAEDGQPGIAEENKRRSDHGEQKVLHHVNAQQEVCEGVERGEEGEGQRGEAEEKARETPWGEPLRRAMAKRAPAADVEDGEKEQAGEGAGLDPP
jgi:hypothetical protein